MTTDDPLDQAVEALAMLVLSQWTSSSGLHLHVPGARSTENARSVEKRSVFGLESLCGVAMGWWLVAVFVLE